MKSTKQTPEALRQLEWSAVRMDGGTQSRVELSLETANRYAENMREGTEYDPIIVFHGPDDRTPADDPHYWLADGFHRMKAYEINGVAVVIAHVYQGSRREAILYAVGANAKEKLHRSREDKRFSVRMILSDPEWAERANNWIATQCHVSNALVESVREEIEVEAKQKEQPAAMSTFRAESGKRIARSGPQAGGGTRTMNTANIGKRSGRKPVRIETRPAAIASLEKKLKRSPVKFAVQAIAAGWTLEQAIEVLTEAWEAVPVAEE